MEEQHAATPRRFQESLLALSANSGAETGGGGGGGGLFTEEEAEYLTAGARRVRQLVRNSHERASQGWTSVLENKDPNLFLS